MKYPCIKNWELEEARHLSVCRSSAHLTFRQAIYENMQSFQIHPAVLHNKLYCFTPISLSATEVLLRIHMRTFYSDDDLNRLTVAKSCMLLLSTCQTLSFYQSMWSKNVSPTQRPERVQLFSISQTDLMGQSCWTHWFSAVRYSPFNPFRHRCHYIGQLIKSHSVFSRSFSCLKRSKSPNLTYCK